MITELLVYESGSVDPFRNLAVEQALLEGVREGQCVLYLWQNENTVVIGRNQNPWKECKTALLEQVGGCMARRLSGGGAVFHDMGNLNYTFLMPQEEFDLDRQLAVIQKAAADLGIPVEKSGRNDLLAGGRKFSGNAFYKNGKQAYHHGTLLVDVDMEKLGRYLSPSKAKLEAKGVDSVRSRVVNLRTLNGSVTVDSLKNALKAAFSQVYGLPVSYIPEADPDPQRVRELTERNRSWEWNYGQKLPFTLSCEGRFCWGSVELRLQVEGGVIRRAVVYSDAMDWALAKRMEEMLAGCRLEPQSLAECPAESGPERDCIQLLLKNALT